MDVGGWKGQEGLCSYPAHPGPSPPPLLCPQAPEDRCLLHLPVGRAAGAAPDRAVPAGRLTRLAGHAQVQHHVPVLPGGLHGSSGHKEGDRPAEVPAPKVREAAVTAGGGQTDGQARSRVPLTCVLPASLLPLPSLEPPVLPAPPSHPPKCPLAAHHCRRLSGQRPRQCPETGSRAAPARPASDPGPPAGSSRSPHPGRALSLVLTLWVSVGSLPLLSLCSIPEPLARAGDSGSGWALAAWPPWAARRGQVLLSRGRSRAPHPGPHITSLFHPSGPDGGPANPRGAGEARGHRAAPPGLQFACSSKAFLRPMVPQPPSPGMENTVLGSRLGLTMSVWGEAFEGDSRESCCSYGQQVSS